MENVISEFGLTIEQTRILFSYQYLLTLNDIQKETIIEATSLLFTEVIFSFLIANIFSFIIGFIIVAILVGIMLPNLYAPSGQAKRKITCIHIQSINDALKNFKLQNGVYPTTEEGILALVKNPNPNSSNPPK